MWNFELCARSSATLFLSSVLCFSVQAEDRPSSTSRPTAPPDAKTVDIKARDSFAKRVPPSLEADVAIPIELPQEMRDWLSTRVERGILHDYRMEAIALHDSLRVAGNGAVGANLKVFGKTVTDWSLSLIETKNRRTANGFELAGEIRVLVHERTVYIFRYDATMNVKSTPVGEDEPSEPTLQDAKITWSRPEVWIRSE